MARMLKNNAVKEMYTSNQIRLISSSRKLWGQQIMLTRLFIISTAAELGDLPVVTKQLLQNPVDFANLVRPFYGREKAMKFQSLFQEHLLIAAKLIYDAKAGKLTAVKEYKKKWHENADKIAAFLANINPNWSKQEWQTMLYNHLKMTENEAVERLNGQYNADIMQYHSIEDEVFKMADIMSTGIIKQFKYR